MKTGTLFILFILFSSLLIFLGIWVYAEDIYLKRLEAIRISKIQKVCMKDYPRKRDHHIIERNADKAQLKINKLLAIQPLSFEKEGFLEENQSTELKRDTNKVVLARIIDVLNNMNETVVLNIEVHTDEIGSNQENLKFSQTCADRLKSYIEKRSELMLITAIGYVEEFPLYQSDDNLSNKRIEIGLKKVEQ